MGSAELGGNMAQKRYVLPDQGGGDIPFFAGSSVCATAHFSLTADTQKELPEIRKEAMTDLDKCVVHILRRTLEYLSVKGVAIDDMTEKTYDFYTR